MATTSPRSESTCQVDVGFPQSFMHLMQSLSAVRYVSFVNIKTKLSAAAMVIGLSVAGSATFVTTASAGTGTTDRYAIPQSPAYVWSPPGCNISWRNLTPGQTLGVRPLDYYDADPYIYMGNYYYNQTGGYTIQPGQTGLVFYSVNGGLVNIRINFNSANCTP